MPDLLVTVTLGHGAKTLVLTPKGAATLRKLERQLVRAGLCPTITRSPKRAVVSVDDIDLVTQGLEGWDVEFDSETKEYQRSTAEGIEAQDRARKSLQHLERPGVAREALNDFEDIEVLDQHQVVAVAAITHPDIRGLCLFDEQGLGKTIQALFGFHRLKQEGLCDLLVIFAPKNMVMEWSHEAERFFPGTYHVSAVVGLEADKRASLNEPADVYVTNYETAVRLKTRMRQLLQSAHGRSLLVVDESFFVKNPGAQRTRAMKELREHAGRCLVLCGTPAPNAPHDLVEQFNIADGGLTFHGVTVPEDREEARPVVRDIIEAKGVYLRRLKQDVLPELPPKTFNRVLIPMEPVQEQLYGDGLVGLIERLNTVDDVTFQREYASFTAHRQTLLQLCSNPGNVSDRYDETPAKLLALDSILEELIERRGEKVVVWSFYTRSLDTIFRRFSRFNPVRIDGTVSDVRERREAVRRFQEDHDTMLFVGNPAAAGAGLTLHSARYAVYESFSNQAAHYLQSLDRIHRRGQERAVEYIVLLCDRTLEINEYERLINKERAAEALLGDDVDPPITRETMLGSGLID